MKRIKLRIANWLFKKYFKLILEEEILFCDPKTGKMYLRGNELTKEQVSALASQARAIRDTEFWGLLLKEMQYLAIRKGFIESLSVDDNLGGKFMLYTIDVLSKKVYNMSVKV